MNNQLQYWRPQLRRAVMKSRPEYFGWPRERQERWGTSMPEEDRASFEAALIEELFGQTFSTREEAAAAADNLPIDELNLWNETVLPLHGIGEDCFFLNEVFADDESILDFETVRDYDENHYRFQENASKEEDPGFTVRPYRGSLYLSWARLFVDGRFTYATMSTAAGYIHAGLEDTAAELIERRIPHRYVPGQRHGRVEGECWEWDLRLEANGEEGILDELNRRVMRYSLDRWDALLTAYDELDLCGAYLFDQSEPGESGLHFVFTDKRALSAVRFRSFLRDCRRIERTRGEIERTLASERDDLANFVENQLAEVRRTYDPKVSRLEKRRKIMVRKDAFD